MIDPRELEIQQAQSNPSILSNLSGAPTQAESGISPSPVPPEATQAAQGLSSELYGGGFVSGGADQRESQMQELFRIDQAMEKNYNPLPTPEWYTPNPADQSGLYGAMGGQVGQNIGASTKAIGGAESAYQTAVGGLLDKFTDFYRIQKEEERDKEDREYKKKLDQFDMEMEIAKISGGQVTNPFTGEKIAIPTGAGEKLTEPERARQTEQTVIDEIRDESVSLEEIIRRHPELDPVEVANMNERIWGPLAESDEEARLKFGFDPSELTSRQRPKAEELKPLSSGAQTKINKFKDIIYLIDVAEADMESGGFFGGKHATGQIEGRIPWRGAKVRQSVSGIGNFVRNEISGAQVTPSEAEFLQPLIPKTTDRDEDIVDKMAGLKEFYNNRITSVYETAGLPVPNGGIVTTLGGGGDDLATLAPAARPPL